MLLLSGGTIRLEPAALASGTEIFLFVAGERTIGQGLAIDARPLLAARPFTDKATQIMRPSPTFNAAIEALSGS